MISMFLLVVENDLPGVKKLTDCSVSQPFQLPSEPPKLSNISIPAHSCGWQAVLRCLCASEMLSRVISCM